MTDESIVTRFIGDNVSLRRTIRDNRSLLTGYQSRFGAIAGVIGRLSPLVFGLGGAAGVAAFTRASAAVEQRLETLDNLGGQFNATRGQAVELARAANESAIELRDLLEAGQQLNEGLVELRAGGTGGAADALRTLGVSADQLGRAFAEGGAAPLLEVLQAVQQLAEVDAPAANKALKDLFGEEGARILAGRLEDIIEALQRARGLGRDLVVDDDAREDLDRFTDAWRNLGNTIENVTNQAVAQLAELAGQLGITGAIESADARLREFSPAGLAARGLAFLTDPFGARDVGAGANAAARQLLGRVVNRGSQVPDVLRQATGGARGGFVMGEGTGTINGQTLEAIRESTARAVELDRQSLTELRKQTSTIQNNLTGRITVVGE